MPARLGCAHSLLRDETAATAVEYGLMVALIAAIIGTVVTTLGTDVNTVFANFIASW